MKHKLCLWLAVLICMSVLLTACSAGQTAPDATADAEAANASAVTPIDISGLPEGWCCQQTGIPASTGAAQPEAQCVRNETVYSIANAPAVLGAADTNGNVRTLPLPELPYLYGVSDTGAALALLSGSYPSVYYDEAGVPVSVDEPEGQYAITLYDESETLTRTIQLSQTYPQTVCGFAAAAEAYYLMFSDRVVRLDANGVQTAEQDAFDGRLLQVLFTDDALYLRVEGSTLYQTETVVRLNADTLSQEAEFSCGALDIHGLGAATDGGVLLVSNTYLFRLDVQTGAVSAILSWPENANTPSNNYQSVLENDTGLFALNSSDEAACFYTYLPDGETLPEPTELTLYQATISDLPLSVYISGFQKLYPQYRITLIQKDTTQDDTAALTELGAGDGYDLYLLGENQWQQLQDAEIFEDLLPWMRADASDPLSEISSGIRQVLTKTGALYRLPIGYSIATYAVDPNHLDEYTPGAVVQACEASEIPLYPFAVNFGPNEDGSENRYYVESMAELCAREYVDIESLTCRFDSDSFKDQLRLVKLQEPVTSAEDAYNGLLYFDVITDAKTVSYSPTRYALPEMENYVLCGYPSDTGNGNTLRVSELFAIRANSEQKSAAWAFLSYLLTQTCQEKLINRLPLNDSVLQNQLSELQEQQKITQAEIGQFYALLDTLQTADYPTAAVEQIIKEELSPYLAGEKTEEETAEIIQSRVQLWIAEQFG